MPIYEYEPDDRECLMCEGRIAVIQEINDEPLRYCPQCGLEVIKVVSRAAFQISKSTDPEQAAKRGFSTFRKLEKGKWEKIAGPDQKSDLPVEKGEFKVDDLTE